MKSILLASALALLGTVTSSNIFHMEQCDPLWGSEKLGFSADKTICTSGSAVTCLAMLLDDSYYGGALGWVSPKTLNTWLIANNGYTNEN